MEKMRKEKETKEKRNKREKKRKWEMSMDEQKSTVEN